MELHEVKMGLDINVINDIINLKEINKEKSEAQVIAKAVTLYKQIEEARFNGANSIKFYNNNDLIGTLKI